MKLIFIDEVCGVVDKNLFGLCAIVIDSTKYKGIHEEFNKTLSKQGWPIEAELKGSYLFSNDPVSTGKRPSEMVDLVTTILDHLTSKTNSRCEVFFSYNMEKQTIANYKVILPSILNKIQKAPSGAGKNIASIYLDNWNQIESRKNKMQIDAIASQALLSRGYNLVESQAATINSKNTAVGVCYADIVAYISRWVIENPKTATTNRQTSLFDLYDEEVKTEIMLKKIDTTRKLADMIKKFHIMKV